MSLSEALLYDVYMMHYQTARKEHQLGHYAQAKQSYLQAAEVMLKLAKTSEGTLKKNRVEKAKKLSSIATELEASSLSINEQMASNDHASIWKPIAVPDISFTDIAGLEDVKQSINVRMIFPTLHHDKYKLYQKKQGGGIILYGPPGTGKTMIARAIAHEVNAIFYVIKPSDILSKYVGESEKHIKSLFDEIRKHDRVVLFFDELDGLFNTRGNDEHNNRRLSEFLQHMDGFEKMNGQVLILGATNRPWDIDSAARRPGRFSQSIFVPLPDESARKQIIEHSLRDVPGYKSIHLNELIEKTKGYSGADLDELCDQAKEYPLLRSIKSNLIEDLNDSDIENALEVVKPSVSASDMIKFKTFNSLK